MPKQRLRPIRRQAEASRPARQSSSSAAPQRTAARPIKSKPQWRETIDSFGGFLTIGAIHLWGPGGVWLAIGAMFLVWWGGLVRRAWREQGGRDRGADQ